MRGARTEEDTAERKWESMRSRAFSYCTVKTVTPPAPKKRHLKEWVRGSKLGISKMLKRGLQKHPIFKDKIF